MLYHQNRLAQVNVGSIAFARSQIFGACTSLFDCFQNSDLGILARVPAVADDAVGGGVAAGEVVGLRRAGDGGERRSNARQSRARGPARQVRRRGGSDYSLGSGRPRSRRPFASFIERACSDERYRTSACRIASLQHPIVLAGDRLAEVHLQAGREHVPGVGFDLEVRGERCLASRCASTFRT